MINEETKEVLMMLALVAFDMMTLEHDMNGMVWTSRPTNGMLKRAREAHEAYNRLVDIDNVEED